MSKDRLYLDTSVPSAYFDERNLLRMKLTQDFWTLATQEYELGVSDITFSELMNTKSVKKRNEMLDLVANLPLFSLGTRSNKLALEYLAGNLVPPSRIETLSKHIAIAVENGFDFLVSWNFSHMVNARTQRRLPGINAQNGYFKQLLIVTPEAFPERNLT